MKRIFVLFNHVDNQWYTFSKKNEEQKKTGLEAEKRLMVRFTLRFIPFKLYIDGKRCWTWKIFLYLWWPSLISYSTMCSFRQENLPMPSLERFTLCKQELNCQIEKNFQCNGLRLTLTLWRIDYDVPLQPVLLWNCYKSVQRCSRTRMSEIVN